MEVQLAVLRRRECVQTEDADGHRDEQVGGHVQRDRRMCAMYVLYARRTTQNGV